MELRILKFKRTRLRRNAEYIFLRGILLMITRLPYQVSLIMCKVLAVLHYIIDARHRKRTLHNLRITMNLRGRKAREFALKTYLHLGEVLAETVYLLPRLTPDNFRNYIEIENEHYVQEALSGGKGAVLVGGHIGNWEIIGVTTAMLAGKLYSVARLTGNERVDGMVKDLRTRFGQEIIPKKGAMKSLVRALRNGYGVGILMDQDGKSRGSIMPFMGQPASTLTTAARLAYQTGAPALFGYCHRIRTLRYRIRYLPPFFLEKTADRTDITLNTTRKLNRMLEEAIRANPTQWLWPHRRWKTGLKNREGENEGQHAVESSAAAV